MYHKKSIKTVKKHIFFILLEKIEQLGLYKGIEGR